MSDAKTISIIIPTWNEASRLRKTVSTPLSEPAVELLVVDGGSTDGTPRLAVELGLRVVSSPKNRAVQMNTGARLTAGSALLFLHADTHLPNGFADEVRKTLRTPGTVGGAFSLRLDSPLRSLRVIERAVNWRSRRFSMPYGDQALFLTRAAFERLGGFREIPLMEDFELVRRLRRLGHVRTLSMAAVSSARRWERLGPWKTTILNQLIICAYLMGVSPRRLSRIYHGRAAHSSAETGDQESKSASIPETKSL